MVSINSLVLESAPLMTSLATVYDLQPVESNSHSYNPFSSITCHSLPTLQETHLQELSAPNSLST